MNRIATLLSFLERDPNDAFSLYALALEYVNRGEEDTAAQWFERLLAAHPEYLALYYHYGQLKARTGDETGAEALYRTGHALALKQNNRHTAAELREALAAVLGMDSEDVEL